jgi:hypothetical protein
MHVTLGCRGFWVTAASLIAALTLAACGSSSTKTTAARTRTSTATSSTTGSGAVVAGTTTVGGTTTTGTLTTTTTTSANGKSKSHGPKATTVASVLVGPAKTTTSTTPTTTTKTTTTAHTNTSTTQTKTVTVTITKTTTAPQPPPAGQPYHLVVFRSPSGNIGCQMQTWAARCDINLRDWSPPPKPSSCKFTWGQGLRIAAPEADNFTWVCSGISLVSKTAPALPYGASNVQGFLTCTSAEAGITCKNHNGKHGFFISRASFRTF